ncbi:hypothetical protein H920_19681 [Fukomys damarensis]|uniref:Uncharacterized protein n=1 Tax=Fukomys damarensis TaxID=885580 RepID=A0A091CM47_FUKDA|nr:hypothetical protein H920_19681 [Fukomys damarensis]
MYCPCIQNMLKKDSTESENASRRNFSSRSLSIVPNDDAAHGNNSQVRLAMQPSCALSGDLQTRPRTGQDVILAELDLHWRSRAAPAHGPQQRGPCSPGAGLGPLTPGSRALAQTPSPRQRRSRSVCQAQRTPGQSDAEGREALDLRPPP